jgi:hypothetical protein
MRPLLGVAPRWVWIIPFVVLMLIVPKPVFWL